MGIKRRHSFYPETPWQQKTMRQSTALNFATQPFHHATIANNEPANRRTLLQDLCRIQHCGKVLRFSHIACEHHIKHTFLRRHLRRQLEIILAKYILSPTWKVSNFVSIRSEEHTSELQSPKDL